MEFNNKQAIYLQIADVICDRIILQEVKEDERVLSVRDMAVELEVNPNTVMRAYELLQAKNIINNKRGIGYFVSVGGYLAAISFRKEEFMQKELPQLFKTVSLLQLDFNMLQAEYEKYLSTSKLN